MVDNTFEVDINGKTETLKLNSPSGKQHREAQKEYIRAFNDAVQAGAILRTKLDDFIREQKIWDDNKEQEAQGLRRTIADGEKALDKGGISLNKAADIAKKTREARLSLYKLMTKVQELDVNTAEAQADNARFNYLVSVCTVYNTTGKPVFKSLDDYFENADQLYAIRAANKFARITYGLSEDIDGQFKENQFLREYGFTDDQHRLINKDGHLIDSDGRLINEYGQWVNENGDAVDEDGNLLEDVKFSPFLDDDGNPVVNKEEETEDSDAEEKEGVVEVQN